MLPFSWSRWLPSSFRRRVTRTRKPQRRPSPRFLRLEELEPRLAPSVTFTWSGADVPTGNSNWSDPNNWVGGIAPTGKIESDGTYDNLVFGAAGNPQGVVMQTNNDIGGIFNSIAIQQRGYVLVGSKLQIGIPTGTSGGNVVASGGVTATIGMGLDLEGLSGAQQFFTVNKGATLTITGPISGTGGSVLTKEGTGTLVLAGDNSGFTGPVFIDSNSGVVVVQSTTGLGNGSNVTTVNVGSQLALDDVPGPINESLILNGTGPKNDGALINIGGYNTWAGPVEIDTDVYIGALVEAGVPGGLTITGVISDSGAGHNITKVGPGFVGFGGANTYRGVTTVADGILAVENPLGLGITDGTTATGTVVTSTPAGTGTLQLLDPTGVGFVVQDELLNLSGTGYNGIGALDNVAGTNYWTGDVTLGSPTSNADTVAFGAELFNGQPSTGVIGQVPGDPGTGIIKDWGPPVTPVHVTKVGPGRIAFASANTFQGDVTVAGGMLNLRDSLALGVGPGYKVGSGLPSNKTVLTQVNYQAALELEVDQLPDSVGPFFDTTHMFFNYPLKIVGRGTGSTGGALRSISGVNVWAGSVQLGETILSLGPPYANSVAIGVDADPNPSSTNLYITQDYSLTVTGVIENDLAQPNEPFDVDFAKVGLGQLILTGKNTYTANTTIEQGWVTVENTSAFGGKYGSGGVPNGPGSVSNTVQPWVRVLAGAALHLYDPNPKAGSGMVFDRVLMLSGTGFNDPFAAINQGGALENLQGDNTWSGPIYLNGKDGIGAETPFTNGQGQPQPSQLTITGEVEDLSSLHSTLGDPGFTTGLQPTVGTSDSWSGGQQVDNIINTGAQSGTLVIHYNTLDPLFTPDSIQIYNGIVGQPGTDLIAEAPFFTTGVEAYAIDQNDLMLIPPLDNFPLTETVTVPWPDVFANPFSNYIDIIVNQGGDIFGNATQWNYSVTFLPANSSGGIVKLGSQRVRLQGAGTFTGPVDVKAGVLTVQNDTALGAEGSSVTVENGASLEFANPVQTLNGGTSGGGIQVYGKSLILNGAGDLTGTDSLTGQLFNDPTVMSVTGDNLWRGGGSFASGSLINLPAGGQVSGVTISAAKGTRIQFQGGFDDSANPNGTALVINLGAGNTGGVVLAGISSYRGDTDILQGIVTVENNAGLGAATGSIPGQPLEGSVRVAGGAQIQLLEGVTVGGKRLELQGTGLSAQNLQPVPVHWFSTGPAPITTGGQPGNLPVAGRVTDVTTDPTDPHVIYITAADGGAWVTRDNGLSWRPLLDTPINTLGANIKDQFGNPLPIFAGGIQVDPLNSNIIYVTTGEANFSTDSHFSLGILRSLDAGQHWTLIQGPSNFLFGHTINKLVIDPSDPTGLSFYLAVSPGPNPALFAPDKSGIWKFDNFTGKWTDLTQRISPYRVLNDSDPKNSKTPGLPGPDDDLETIYYKNSYYTDLAVVIDPNNPAQNPDPMSVDPVEPGHTANVFIIFAQGNPDGGPAWTDPKGNGPFFSNGVFISLDDFGLNTNMETLLQGVDSTENKFNMGNGAPYAGIIKFTITGTAPYTPAFQGTFQLYAMLTVPTNLIPATQFLEIDDNTIVADAPPGIGNWGTFIQPSLPNQQFMALGGTGPEYGAYTGAIVVGPQGGPLLMAGIDEPYAAGPLMYDPFTGAWDDVGTGSDGNDPFPNAHAMTVDSNGQAIIATDGGVWRLVSTPPFNPTLWQDLNGNLGITQMQGVAVDAQNPNHSLGGSQGTGLSIFTNHWGQTGVGVGGSAGAVAMDNENSNILYGVQNGTLYQSTDGGNSWTGLLQVSWVPGTYTYPWPDFPSGSTDPGYPDLTIDPGPPPIVEHNEYRFPFVMDQVDPARLVVGNAFGQMPITGNGQQLGQSTLWQSNDRGHTWFDLTPPVDPATNSTTSVTAVALAQDQGTFDPTDTRFPLVPDRGANSYDSDTLYITNGSLIWVTKNLGATWALTLAPWASSGATVDALAVDPRNRDVAYAVLGGLGTGVGHVYVTTDAGRSWSALGTGGGLPDVPAYSIAVDPRNGDVYVGNDTGVYLLPGLPGAQGSAIDPKFQNLKGTWVPFGTGLPSAQVLQIVLDQSSDTLTIATNGRGTFQAYLDPSLPNSGGIRAVGGASAWTGPVYLTGPTTISADGTKVVLNGVTQGSLDVIGPITDLPGTTGSNNTLTKIGLGTVLLSGTNTYGGKTLVTQGVLVVNNPNALGDPAQPTIVNPAATVVSPVVQAALYLQTSLQKEPLQLYGDGIAFNGFNTGALRSISNSNTFTGTIALMTPNVTIGVDSGSSLTINSTSPVAIVNGTGSPSSLTKENTGILIFQTANSYTGGTFVNQGILNIQQSGSMGPPGSLTQVLNGAQLQLQGGITITQENLDLSGSGIQGSGALESVGGANTWASGNITLDQAIPSYFVNSPNPPIPLTSAYIGVLNTGPSDQLLITAPISQLAGLSGNPVMGITKVGPGLLVLNDNNNYPGTATVAAGTMRIQQPAALGTLGGPGAGNGTVVNSGASLQLDFGAGQTVTGETLTLNGTGLPAGTANFVANAGALENYSGNNFWAGPVVLQTNDSIGVDGTTGLTISGVVQDPIPAPVPPANLSKVGPGTLFFTNFNTYTGLTTVAQGFLNVQQGTSTINGLTQSALGAVVNEQQLISLSGSNTGSFTLTFTYQGIKSTTVSILGTATASTVQTDLNNLPSIKNFGSVQVSQGSGRTYVVTFNGGGLAGTLLPQLVPTSTGGTFAKVQITVDGSQGTVVNSGATLQVQGGITVSSEALTLNGSGVNGVGALESVGGQNNTWTIPSNAIVPITLASNAAIGAVTGNTLFLGAPITDNGHRPAFGVTKVGAGTVQYNAATSNTYTGLTQVSDGVLQFNMTNGAIGVQGNLVVGDGTPSALKSDVAQWIGSNQLAASSRVTVNGDGLMDLGGQAQTIDSLTMTGGNVSLPTGSVLTLGFGALTAGADAAGNPANIYGQGQLSLGGFTQTFTINGPGPQAPAADVVIAAPISGVSTEGMTKAGAGTLQLTGNSTYTGVTTISQGLLLADGPNSALTIGDVSIAGGNLGGKGTVGTITSSFQGGTIFTGDTQSTPGTLSSTPSGGNIDQWNSVTNYYVALNGTPAGQFSQLLVNGDLDLGGANLTGLVASSIRKGDTFDIIHSNGGQITGQFVQGNVIFIDGQKFSIAYTNSTNNPNLPVTDVILTRQLAITTVSVKSTDNPSPYGEDVSFTATVTPEPGSTLPFAPADTLTFQLDNLPAVVVPVVNGQASYDPEQVSLGGQPLSVGNHTLIVSFSGDTIYAPSDNTASPFVQVVNRAQTTTTLVATWATQPANLVSGQTFNLTATVAPVAPGTGLPNQTPDTITFFVNGVQQGLPVQMVNGTASTSLALNAGPYQITAVYSGDTNYQPSTSSPLGLTVNQDAVGVSVSANPTSSVFGQRVAFTTTVSPVAPGSGTATGIVTFYDGSIQTGTVIGSGSLISGALTINVSSLAAGTHTITVSYPGDNNFLSNTGTLTFKVNAAQTNTNVASSSNPAMINTPVTFTATVVTVFPGQGVPQGTVTWFVNNVQQGQPITIDQNGQATFISSWAAVGSYNVSAVYSGSSNFGTSTGSVSEIVQSKSQTTLTTSVNPAVFGQPITYTATVAGISSGVGIPTGSVTFVVDGVPTQGVVLDQNGQATFTDSSLAVGKHTVSVNYSGSPYFLSSSSTTLNQTVNKANTKTVVTNPVNPSVFGQGVTFTATVSPVAPGAGTLSGSVQFLLDGAVQATVPISGNQATWSPTIPIGVGTHNIVAVYGSDPSFNGSSSATFQQTVAKAGSSTTIASSSNPSFAAQLVIFTATVSPQSPSTAAPTGQVQFTVNSKVQATVSLVNGQATWTTGSLKIGSYSVDAVYLGSANSAGSTAPAITQTVQKTGTAADSTSLASSLNPAIFGQSVTFTATVTPANAANGPLNGFVTFLLNGVAKTSVPVNSSGVATWTPTSLAVGTYKVTAQYSGDLVYRQSTSNLVTQTVNKVATTASVVSTAPTAIVGELVTYTATVGVQTGSGLPTGSVTFLVDGSARATVKLQTVNGVQQATWTTSFGAPGKHNITVQYSGGGNYAASNKKSSPLQQVVIKSGTAGVIVTLTSSGSPSQLGQSVTFTANVSAANSANGTPTGQVVFLVDGKVWATINVTGGVASWTTGRLPSGNHTIQAIYSGDVTFAKAQSAQIQQLVQNNAKVTRLSATATANSDGSFTIVATALDSGNNVVTTFNSLGQLSIDSGPGGALLGQLAVNFVNGVATFHGVDTTIPGTYVLDVFSGNLLTTVTINTGGRET